MEKGKNRRNGGSQNAFAQAFTSVERKFFRRLSVYVSPLYAVGIKNNCKKILSIRKYLLFLHCSKFLTYRV